MDALVKMIIAHPIGSTWLAGTVWIWIAIYVRTGGGWRHPSL